MNNSDLWLLRDQIEHDLEPPPEPEFVTTPYRAATRSGRRQYKRPHRPPKPCIAKRKDNPMRLGEVKLKTFVNAEMLRLNAPETRVRQMIRDGQYPNLRIRTINRRVVFVIPPKI